MTLELTPMSRAEFASWRDGAQGDLADEPVAIGLHEADVAERAAQILADLLPDGLQTKGHHLWTVRRSYEPVGVAWLSLRDRIGGTEAEVHDLLIERPWRGQGLGRKLMEAIEAFVRSAGARSISMRMFGRNRAGLALSESLGYQLSSRTMRKSLAAPDPRG